jgi:hypothetical protein
MPDLKIVYLLNGLCAGGKYVADVSRPYLEIATIFGVETYAIRPSNLGPEGFVATVDENKMPRDKTTTEIL